MIRPVVFALLLLAPMLASMLGAGRAQADIFTHLDGSLWAFPEREGMRCHENPHSIHFSSDRQKAFFDWDGPMINYLGEVDQAATYDVIEHDATSITLFLHGEARKTATQSPVLWILRLPDAKTYCWDRADWETGQCTHVHVRCDLTVPIS